MSLKPMTIPLIARLLRAARVRGGGPSAACAGKRTRWPSTSILGAGTTSTSSSASTTHQRPGRPSSARAGRCAQAALLGVLLSMAWAPAALAARGSVSLVGGTLTFRASPGIANDISISHQLGGADNSNLHIVREVETGATLTAAQPCLASGPPPDWRVYCRDSAGIARVAVYLGDSDDKLRLSPPFANSNASALAVDLPATVNGGLGNDQLTGGSGPDVLRAGSGRNALRGGAGNDQLMARNGQTDYAIHCGAGTDVAVIDAVDPTPVGCETVTRP